MFAHLASNIRTAMRRLSVLVLICGGCVVDSANGQSVLEKISPFANILESTVMQILRPTRDLDQPDNKTCCASGACICPYPLPMPVPMPLPMPVVQQPVVIPARTVFEPVIHDHPPLYEIQNIVRKHKKKRRRRPCISSSYSDNSDNSDSTSTSSDESSIEYYDDFIGYRG